MGGTQPQQQLMDPNTLDVFKFLVDLAKVLVLPVVAFSYARLNELVKGQNAMRLKMAEEIAWKTAHDKQDDERYEKLERDIEKLRNDYLNRFLRILIFVACATAVTAFARGD